jgi:hypothetical protein
MPAQGVLAWATMVLPTTPGVIHVAFNQSSSVFTANVTVPSGSTARVCLPRPTATTGETSPNAAAAAQRLSVDGAAVSGEAEGRMLCAPTNLTAGKHMIIRE